MKAAERYARGDDKFKAAIDKARQEYSRQASERMKAWWASRTAEQRQEVCDKMKEGRRNSSDPPRPGHVCGEKHYMSKLTETKVRAIHADERPATLVAVDYGVHPETVRDIWRGVAWAHLGLPVRDRRPAPAKTKPKPIPPLLSKEIRDEIDARPFDDTRELAKELGVHWMDVATYRQKRYRRGLR